MPRLSDGTVIPSFFACQTSSEAVKLANEWNTTDVALHAGYVVAIHYPNSDSQHQKWGEAVYDIAAPVSFGTGGRAFTYYFDVRWAGGIVGSINDISRPRLNFPKGWKRGEEFTADMEKEASYVAFACANGIGQNAYIVGVIRHPSNASLDTKELGHYFTESYNGINTLINKDGEYSLTFTGAILDAESNKYIKAPDATTGTTIVLDKEGSLLLDNVKGESIKLDKKNQTTTVKARAMTVTVAEKDYASSTTKGKITFLAKTNAVFNGAKVYIGKEGSTEPLVLGNKLATALKELIVYLTADPLGVAGNIPVMMNPALKGNLNTWKNKYGTNNTSAFLSKKGFVE
jgi:hypothetical protein